MSKKITREFQVRECVSVFVSNEPVWLMVGWSLPSREAHMGSERKGK
jgi:hypothetical protein